MADDLDGLDNLAETITYRASKKVYKRLEELAKQDGRKPGAMARHLLEIALGFRQPASSNTSEFPFAQPLIKKKKLA